MPKLDYVICVNAPTRWFVPAGDEDDIPPIPAQSTDPQLVGRYDFNSARQTVRMLASRYPNMQFKVDTMMPLASD